MSIESLKYSDERDKSYGMAGMAIALVASDGQNLMAHISLDGDADSGFEMSHDFFFRGNPRMSAKWVWKTDIQHLALAVRMVLGNVVCRSYVMRGQQQLDRTTADLLRREIREVADEGCALALDEADGLFDESYRFVHRLFSHVGVHAIADGFVEELRRRREMSVAEVVELMNQLGSR